MEGRIWAQTVIMDLGAGGSEAKRKVLTFLTAKRVRNRNSKPSHKFMVSQRFANETRNRKIHLKDTFHNLLGDNLLRDRQITTYRMTSSGIACHGTRPCGTVSYGIISYGIVSFGIVSYGMTSYRIISGITSCSLQQNAAYPCKIVLW